jgi:hypothetical protein
MTFTDPALIKVTHTGFVARCRYHGEVRALRITTDIGAGELYVSNCLRCPGVTPALVDYYHLQRPFSFFDFFGHIDGELLRQAFVSNRTTNPLLTVETNNILTNAQFQRQECYVIVTELIPYLFPTPASPSQRVGLANASEQLHKAFEGRGFLLERHQFRLRFDKDTSPVLCSIPTTVQLQPNELKAHLHRLESEVF